MDPTVPSPHDFPSAADPGGEWDDPLLPSAPAAVSLPAPRWETAAAPLAATRRPAKAEIGLRIGTRMRGSYHSAAAREAVADEPAAAVIKLECPPADQPFQASQIIPAPKPDGPATPPGGRARHPAWGGGTAHLPRWLIAGGLGVTSVLAFALVAQERWLRDVPADTPPELELADKETLLPEIEGFETDGSSEREARELMHAYALANTAAQILPLVRNRQALAARITRDWQPWVANAAWQGAWTASWESASEEGLGFGLLIGRRPDFASFRAYFVREDGALKLDWEATEGRSAAAEFHLLASGLGSGGTVRAYVKPDAYYTRVFPEDRYHCFKLVAPSRQDVIWAYAEVDSPADTRIMTFFESGTFLETSPNEVPMTLKLAPPPQGAEKNQWLLPEMLHNEWVSP